MNPDQRNQWLESWAVAAQGSANALHETLKQAILGCEDTSLNILKHTMNYFIQSQLPGSLRDDLMSLCTADTYAGMALLPETLELTVLKQTHKQLQDELRQRSQSDQALTDLQQTLKELAQTKEKLLKHKGEIEFDIQQLESAIYKGVNL